MDVLALLFAALLVLVVIIGLRRRPDVARPETPPPSASLRYAAIETAELAQARGHVERDAARLEESIQRGAERIGFQGLRQLHRESRLTADAWHERKRRALVAKNALSDGLNTLRKHERALTQRHNESVPYSRAGVIQELNAVKRTIDSHNVALAALTAEIQRGRELLIKQNQQTGRVRDYIRDNCGQAGRQWYQELQDRTVRRRGKS